MSNVRENRVKKRLREGQWATCLTGINSPDMTDFLGQFGFEAIWIDMEHGNIGWEQMANITRACDLWDMTSLCRVNSNQPSLIGRALDVGATGVAIPRVNTKDEAERAAKAAKYGPRGYRGYCPGRQFYGVEDAPRKINEQSMVMVIIEEMEAVNNLPEILTVDDIDVFLMGPGDLSQNMSYLGQLDHPDVLRVIDDSIAQIVAAGRVAGALVNENNVERYMDVGARFFLTTWRDWVAQGARNYLSKVEATQVVPAHS